MTAIAVNHDHVTSEPLALDLDWDLISHLGLAPSVSTLRSEHVNAMLIEDPLAREVFAWQMEHFREYGTPATGSVLEDQFPAITVSAPRTAVGDLIDRLRTRYMRNKGGDIAKRIAIAVREDPLAAPKEMLRGGRELADLVAKRGDFYGTGDYYRLMDAYDAKAVKGRGPSLGYPELDVHFNGMLGVTFLIGAPKSYKSWFTINAIKENITAGKSVHCYSLELPADEYTMRLQHMVADIPYSTYLKHAYMPHHREQLKDVNELLDGCGRYLIEKPPPGERGVQRMIEQALNGGADAIYIDQLQYMENRKGVNLGTANNTGDYWEVCNDLRDYSDQVPIFVVHQFNRSVMRATELPEAQQAKGSAAVEEVATLALGLWSNKDMRRYRLAEIGTLASRNYDLATWELQIELSEHCALDMKGLKEEPDEYAE